VIEINQIASPRSSASSTIALSAKRAPERKSRSNCPLSSADLGSHNSSRSWRRLSRRPKPVCAPRTKPRHRPHRPRLSSGCVEDRGCGSCQGVGCCPTAYPEQNRYEVFKSLSRKRIELFEIAGAPEEIRTPDPQIRSLVLYPAELRARRLSPATELGAPARMRASSRFSGLRQERIAAAPQPRLPRRGGRLKGA
jgi:hypothetical protein